MDNRTSTVLTSVAMVMGQKSRAMVSKLSMSATPGGTKKKPRLLKRKSEIAFTHSSFTHPISRKAASNSIPTMLPGRLKPVTATSSSPSAMQPKRIVHCLTMMFVMILDMRRNYIKKARRLGRRVKCERKRHTILLAACSVAQSSTFIAPTLLRKGAESGAKIMLCAAI